MKALGWNIIEVFEGFASQEGLEIFITSKFYICKVSREEILLRGGRFHEAAAGLVTCMMMIIISINLQNYNSN